MATAAASSAAACRQCDLPCFSHPLPSCTQAFFFDVVSKGEAVACKHQLAARLAAALGKAREATVPDLTLAHLLQE